MANEHIERLKQIVEHGGGLWVSCQEAEAGDSVEAYILFQAPLSQKLLMLPNDEFFTTNAVQEKVHNADKEIYMQIKTIESAPSVS